MSGDVWIAFGLTLFAGMATGIGSIIAFTASRTNFRFLSISTGFSAGVMLYVSFVEIFYKGIDALSLAYGEYWAHWINSLSFFAGMFLIGVIDNLIPSDENPHETRSENKTAPLHDRSSASTAIDSLTPCHDSTAASKAHPSNQQSKLLRMGFFTAIAIGIHNFPEGLATFLAALQSPSLGIAIAVAVALHNIPEGISVSVPIFYATGNRKKAFVYSILSGLAEPVGAIVAYLALRMFVGNGSGTIPPQVMGATFAGVAGIMVYISLDELLPTSRAFGKGHDSLLGLIGGMMVMALSLLLMQ